MMNKRIALMLAVISIFFTASSFAGHIIHSWGRCYIEEPAKLPAAQACEQALGKEGTLEQILQCHLSSGFITPTPCPEENK